MSTRIGPKRIRRTAPSHVAMSRALGPYRAEVAEALGLSRSTVDQWCNGRIRGPLDRIDAGVSVVAERDYPLDDALAGVWWLAARRSRRLQAVEPIVGVPAKDDALARCAQEFGHALAMLIKFLEDDLVEGHEVPIARRLFQDCYSAWRQLETVVESRIQEAA